MRGLVIAAAAGLLLGRTVPDPAAPRPLVAVPLAVPAGFAGKVTVRGLKLDGLTSVTADGGVTAKLVGKGRKAAPPKDTTARKAGDTESEIELSVPKGFAGGHVTLTLTAPNKKPVPFRLTIDPAGTVAEVEPNDGFAQAHLVMLSATVAGVIQREKDVDVFEFKLTAGQRVRVEVDAAKLGSPADLTLTAWDADRHILASADDTPAGPDPAVEFTAPRAGDYFVSVAEASDRGGPAFGYRLRVTGR